jgi:hypothetical protein
LAQDVRIDVAQTLKVLRPTEALERELAAAAAHGGGFVAVLQE